MLFFVVFDILEFFLYILGLKINSFKIKIVWIGFKKFFNEVFYYLCWKFDWGFIFFNLFGIEFFVDLDKMILLNYNK